MQTREIKRNSNQRGVKKSWFIIIGSLIFVIGFIFTLVDFIEPIIYKKEEENALEKFYEQEEKIDDKIDKTTSEEVKVEEKPIIKYEYIAVLKIPKINLEKGIVARNSKYNNINYGIEILKESDSPDVLNGNVILASHSGTANVSYFKNLDKINVGDEAIILYQGKTYRYIFTKIYDVEKNGKIQIKKDKNKSTLTLITCRRNANTQIVLIAELQNCI